MILLRNNPRPLLIHDDDDDDDDESEEDNDDDYFEKQPPSDSAVGTLGRRRHWREGGRGSEEMTPSSFEMSPFLII